MAKINETGHAKNVANFEDLKSFCEGYGIIYNPSKTTLKLTALNTLFTKCQTAINNTTASVTAFNKATNNRQDAFEGLRILSTQILNAFTASDVSDNSIDDAKSINRKIQGTRATPKIKVPDNAQTPDNNTISVAQLSFDQLIEHLNKFIELLKTEPNYAPNETELKVTTLTTRLTKMRATNTAVSNATKDLSNARIIRDDLLYKKDTGLYDIAMDVKKYIKSVFKASSPQYKQVSGIKFTKPR